MIFTESELQEMARLLEVPSLSIQVRAIWGSINENHRELIRADLESQGSQLYSISHTENLGGYAIVPESAALKIGFDVEQIARVTDAVARRVCEDPHEFLEAPSAAALWCAKEAGFKSLQGPDQPAVIPWVTPYGWRHVSHYETFQIRCRQNLPGLKTRGLSFQKGDYQFAIVCRSN